MSSFKLYIEYEGTRYSGWQIQNNAKTVQGKIFEAARKIFKTNKIDIQGSGRTDSGVHAICQVAHMEVNTVLAPEIIRMKINDELPADINIIEVEKANPKFHARHDAIARSYVYQISQRRTAFAKPFVWWVKDKLNFAKMEKASKLFIGMYDFTSFTDDDREEKSTKVMIENVEMKKEGDLILIRITGSHFLWKMVRRVVGVLVELGRGHLTESDIKEYLSTESNEPARHTAPPSGLFLEKVFYMAGKNEKELSALIKVNSEARKK